MTSIVIPKFRTALFPSPSGQRCFNLLLPDDHKFAQLIAGLYALTTDVENWDGDEADSAAIAQAFLDAYTEMDWSACLTSDWVFKKQRVWADMKDSQSGNNQIWSPSTSRYWGGYLAQSAAAAADSLGYDIALPSGVYSIKFHGLKSAVSAIQIVYLDSVQVGSQDLYNATNVENFEWTITGVNVTENGVHSIQSVAGAKHASSTGYTIAFSYFDVIRTGDL